MFEMGSNGGEEGAGNSFQKKVENQWKRSVDHANKYPYVWASYAVVWGGLGIYTIYKWRKLRNMEDRVRTLQQKLKQLVDEEEAALKKEKEFEQMKSKAGCKDADRVDQTGK